jgi:hypothetical protein
VDFPSNSKTSNFSGNQIVFKSNYTRGGSLIVPQKLIFDRDAVTLITNQGLDSFYTTTYTHSIPNNRITGYRISRFLVGCNITIVGEGFQNIVAVGYTGDDADKIEGLIKKIIRG